MRRSKNQITGGEDLLVGIDLHKNRWHVTIRKVDLELSCASIPRTWEALRRVLDRYAGHLMQTAYEAGYFGFRLHRPPNESFPSGYSSESGPQGIGRVKTGKRRLKRVWVPSEEEPGHHLPSG